MIGCPTRFLRRSLTWLTLALMSAFAGSTVLTAQGSFQDLHSFGNAQDGSNPDAGLTQGGDDTLYGTTNAGGSSGGGTICSIASDGTYAVLHSFAGSPDDGANPLFGGLIRATDGNFYGTTEVGGPHGGGVAFRLDLGLSPLQ